MLLFYFSISFILFVIFKISHDFFHPAFITGFVWLFIVTAYNWVIFKTHIWHELSGYFYVCIFLYLLFFALFSIAATETKFKTTVTKINLGSKYVFFQCLCFLLLFLTDVYLFRMVRQVGMSVIRDELTSMPLYVKLASYASPLELILFCYGFSIKKQKLLALEYWTCFLLMIFQIFLMASKGGYFQILFSIIFLLVKHKKMTKKMFFSLAVCFFILIFALQLARGGGNDKIEKNFLITFFYGYFLSPLPAFDLILTGKINLETNMIGGGSLQFFYRVFEKLGICSAPVLVHRSNNWVSVPVLTNVFTILGNYYTDFRILGIIFAAMIYGLVYGILYSKLRNGAGIYSKIFYALWLYCLVFQFFGDWFFGFFSVTLQSAFWLFIVTHRFKTYSLRYIR